MNNKAKEAEMTLAFPDFVPIDNYMVEIILWSRKAV